MDAFGIGELWGFSLESRDMRAIAVTQAGEVFAIVARIDELAETATEAFWG